METFPGPLEASLQPLPAAGNTHVFIPAVPSAWSTLSCLNNVCLIFKALWRYQLHQETSPPLPWKFGFPPLQPSVSQVPEPRTGSGTGQGLNG